MIKKILGGLIILFYKILFYKKLKIEIPSISFAINPFKISAGSVTKIGKRAIIGKQCQIINKGSICIGNNFCINRYSRVASHENIIIGDNVTIAQFVSVLDHDHAYTIKDNQMKLDGYITAPIVIGNNVWIADKVTICKGVVIGDNVIIAANSVVNKNIPGNSVYGGVPAELLRKLKHD